ncbi:P27 family phage terminase small subunit [Pseudoduganella sp. UC29_106]|uniref:P27 family phage terminase small subunit n=1 Tax=Pseudoduganella sp. UC29_106 TaxID=3374553 RepID=UPI003756A5D9
MQKKKAISIPKPLKDNPVAKAKYRELLALKVWQDAVVILGVDHAVDYCLCYARQVNADAMLRAEGEVVTAPSGYQMPSPWLTIRNRAAADMTRLTKLTTSAVTDIGKKAAAAIATEKALTGGRFARHRSPPPKLVHSK